MNQRRISLFVPMGLLALVAAILYQRYAHWRYSDFAAGVVMGASLVLMIFGVVKQMRGRPK